jgi:hypothetical protein
MKEFDDIKARMRSENTKLSESTKAVVDEMSIKIEIANKKNVRCSVYDCTVKK